jgi:hypothetical protein
MNQVFCIGVFSQLTIVKDTSTVFYEEHDTAVFQQNIMKKELPKTPNLGNDQICEISIVETRQLVREQRCGKVSDAYCILAEYNVAI